MTPDPLRAEIERLSEERLAEIERIDAEATPGPWRWYGNSGNFEVYLATPDRGRLFIMNLRRWGMRGAQPCFQPPSGRLDMVPASDRLVYEVTYRKDIVGIDHPDARFLAQSRQAVADLLAEVKRLRAALRSTAPSEDAAERLQWTSAAVREYGEALSAAGSLLAPPPTTPPEVNHG